MREKFVQGGSDQLGLQPAGKRKHRTVLSESQKEALYRQYLMGEKVADLAAAYDVNESTVRNHIRSMRSKEAGMAFSPKVIAGNKKTGRLVYANNAGDKYEGSHLTSDGEMHHWKFTAKNSAMARQQYEKWCNELDDQCAFLAMVERKPLNDTEEHVEKPVEEAMAEVPEEATEETPDEVTEEVPEETYEVMVAPKMGHVYIIWVKAEKPKLYKAYTDMELALRELDTLNEVSAFLGSGEFEIEEVELKC